MLGTANDSDGTIASVTWTKVSGPTSFSFSNVNAASTNINNLSAGTYVFRLTAIDNNGATSYDEVQVVVNPAIIGTSNIAPTVNAGTDKVITLPTNSVSVAGVATDSDGTISSIKRTKLSGPTSFTIQNDTALSATINNLTMAGTYVFRLTATDNNGASSTDDVQVIVNPMVYTPTATATHYASPVG